MPVNSVGSFFLNIRIKSIFNGTKIANVPVFLYMELSWTYWFRLGPHPLLGPLEGCDLKIQWLAKWIFPHQNHFVPRHINNRYINPLVNLVCTSGRCLAVAPPLRLPPEAAGGVPAHKRFTERERTTRGRRRTFTHNCYRVFFYMCINISGQVRLHLRWRRRDHPWHENFVIRGHTVHVVPLVACAYVVCL